METKALKKISFTIGVIGIAMLVILLNSSPKEVKSIANEKINQKVTIQGKVLSERQFNDFSILQIEGIEAICECKNPYLNKEVRVIGLVEEYQGKRQIKILEIKVIP